MHYHKLFYIHVRFMLYSKLSYGSLFLLIVISGCIEKHNINDLSNETDVIKLPRNKLDT